MRVLAWVTILSPICLLSVDIVAAQDTITGFPSKSNKEPFICTSLSTSIFSKQNVSSFISDSTIREKLGKLGLAPDSNLIPPVKVKSLIPGVPQSTKQFIRVNGGYVSYFWNYRSGNDSSFIENNISQNLVAASINATVAQVLPVRIDYFERRSNSSFFRDYRDVSVDIDVEQYKQLKARKIADKYKSSFNNLTDPHIPGMLKETEGKLNGYKDLLNDPKVVTELIRSKETLARKDFADTTAYFRDSVMCRARKFIDMYDSLQGRADKYQHLKDSLESIYQGIEKKKQLAEKYLNGKQLSAAEMEELAASYGRKDENIQKLFNAYGGIKRLTVGRTLPDFSSLTLQNVNVNGLNVEYARNNIYMGIAAGIVDFRIRDFLINKQTPAKQFVFAARMGYGTKEKNNIILTYFRGKKQLFGGNLQLPVSPVQGISLAGQLYIIKQIRLYGEIAQSGSAYAWPGASSEKPALTLKDNTQRAYAAGFASYFPRMQAVIEGYYQRSGVNYQAFNSFQYNSTANSWTFRYQQYLWRRQLSLLSEFRKNDFVNPLVLQRYNANTVFKNLSLTFNRPKWPIVTVGYLPASQFTAIGNQVYENHYQAFTGSISYQYKLAAIKTNSFFSLSRFFNDSRDSGFVYYNSRSFFLTQNFMFSRFTATINVSGMQNSRYDLVVMEEAFTTTLLKKINIGFGIKINNLNRQTTKVGFNTKAQINIKSIGELNLWMEQSYLPAAQPQLYKYEIYNLGFIKYFSYR